MVSQVENKGQDQNTRQRGYEIELVTRMLGKGRWTGLLGQESQEWTAGIGKPEGPVRVVQQGQEREDRTARKGQQG
jgi:hypothetical protein